MIEILENDVDLKQCKSFDFFRSLTLFADLYNDDVARFSDAAQIKSYKKGKILYVEGETANYFYIICNGWLKLSHVTKEGEEVNLAMLTRNSIMGENAIFEQGRYTNNAEIAEDAQILSVPLNILKEELRTNNQLAFNMLNAMVEYRRLHELQLKQYILYSAPQRIGSFLLGLCPALEQKDGVVINLPYDKTLIASTLGMKGATFSRALNILRQETGIHVTGTRVTIDSIKRLSKFLNGCHPHPYKN